MSTERPVLPPRQKRGRYKANKVSSPQPPQLPPKNKFRLPAKSLDNLDSLDGEVEVSVDQEVPFERCQSYATNRAFDDNNLGRGYEKTPFASESSMMYTR